MTQIDSVGSMNRAMAFVTKLSFYNPEADHVLHAVALGERSCGPVMKDGESAQKSAAAAVKSKRERDARVAALKAAISAGTYRISAADLADKLIEDLMTEPRQ